MGKVISVGPYSAYGIAVKHGYEGTEEEWISSVERDRIAAEKAAKEAKEFAKADPTLTISGAPADAAATGQGLNNRYTKAEIDDKLKNIKTDKTLTVDGGFADAKTVGDSINRWFESADKKLDELLLSLKNSVLGITAPAGVTITVTHRGKKITSFVATGEEQYVDVEGFGPAVVRADVDSVYATRTVDVAIRQLYHVVFETVGTTFGVRWEKNNPSTKLVRLMADNDPYSYVDNILIIPETGTAFDHSYPWKGMEEYNVIDGVAKYKMGDAGFSRTLYDTMVWIPKFWFKVESNSNYMYCYISSIEKEGFILHPGSGRYIGRYKSNGNRSVSGVTFTTTTRESGNSNAKSKGAGWYLSDYSIRSAVIFLYLIEYADWDCQSAVGRGITSWNSSASATLKNNGGTDAMSYCTGTPEDDGCHAVQYRHVENLWGLYVEHAEGVNMVYTSKTWTAWVIKDPDKYLEGWKDGYSSTISWTYNTSGFLSTMYINSLGQFFGGGFSAGSSTTYIPDHIQISKNTSSYMSTFTRTPEGSTITESIACALLACGGGESSGSNAGLFSFYNDHYGMGFSSRLMFIPPESQETLSTVEVIE
mgnify:FL=1